MLASPGSPPAAVVGAAEAEARANMCRAPPSSYHWEAEDTAGWSPQRYCTEVGALLTLDCVLVSVAPEQLEALNGPEHRWQWPWFQERVSASQASASQCVWWTSSLGLRSWLPLRQR